MLISLFRRAARAAISLNFLLVVGLAWPALTAAQAVADDYDPTRPNLQAATPAAVAAKPAEPRKDEKASPRRSFLWEVKSPTNTVYLFGTIHVGKKSFYPLPDTVEQAFASASKLVVEANVTDNSDAANIDAMVRYAPPGTIEGKIPPALYGRLKTQLARLKIPLEEAKRLKPYMVGNLLTLFEFSRLGYDFGDGLDLYFLGKAQRAGMPVLELESQIEQIKLMDGMNPQLQQDFLENSIAGVESGISRDQVTGMVNAWQAGDVALMQAVINEMTKDMKGQGELDELMLYGRHANMVGKIESYLAGKDIHFVAVGSLHLIGKRGVVEMLQAKGYKIKQL